MNAAMTKYLIYVAAIVSLVSFTQPVSVYSSTTPMTNYCAVPPFVSNAVPPMVMVVMSKDHKLFYRAYNDVTDLDGDGVPDTTYTDKVNYYGYFDPNKCYTNPASGSAGQFVPAGLATGTNSHYCSGKWSGNFLNWATMTRLDILRKVLYGGKRLTDTTSTTTLTRAQFPDDVHSWAKVYTGADLAQLTPGTGTAITVCNTNSTSSTDKTGNDPNGSLMKVNWGDKTKGPATPSNPNGGYYPYAATVNQPSGSPSPAQCYTKYDGGATLSSDGSNYATYYVNVQVCNGALNESNCLPYYSGGSTTPTSYKPSGLMEKYGINRQGSTNPANWTPQMYFGLITGTYGGNLSGGVLRANMSDMSNEIDYTTGIFKFSGAPSSTTSHIIWDIDNFRVVNFEWSPLCSGVPCYYDCNLSSSFAEGSCANWGAPIGEMYYEALRYFIGKAAPTGVYNKTDATSSDGTTGLHMNNIMTNYSGSWCNPYVGGGSCPTLPVCSKPNILVLGDEFPDFDSDQLPGVPSAWGGIADDTGYGLNVQTLLDGSHAHIDLLENPSGSQIFTGEAIGTANDYTCSPKTGTFGTIRGLCVEEPTKQGSYYIAGLSWWAHTQGFLNPATDTTAKKVTTYSVVTPSVAPRIQIPVGAGIVKIVPSFYVPNMSPPGRGQLVNMSILTTATPAGGTCPSGATNCVPCPFIPSGVYDDCKTEQANGYQYGYEITYDDSNQGSDLDLDIAYRIYVKTDGVSTVWVKTKGVYANAGYDDKAGYFIWGVGGASGQYLEIGCGGSAGGMDCDRWCSIPSTNPAASYDATTKQCTGTTDARHTYNYQSSDQKVCSLTNWVNCTNSGQCPSGETCNLPANLQQQMADSTVERKFTVNDTNIGVFLQSPLYYAAKYGGFNDTDSNHYPDLSKKWQDPNPDPTRNGLPLTYYSASNPTQLETQLENALLDILRRSSSGTAVSVLASGEGSGANILQSFFFPKKDFQYGTLTTTLSWVGEMQNLWYYIDPTLNASTIREDTDKATVNNPNQLNLLTDDVISFYFDINANKTMAQRFTNSGSLIDTVDIDKVNSLWEGGMSLWQQNQSTRRLYTNPTALGGSLPYSFSSNPSGNFKTSAAATLQPYLDAVNSNNATNLINYVSGTDVQYCSISNKACNLPSDCNPVTDGICTPYRSRTVTIPSVDNTARVWKLSDIVSSTPKIKSWVKLNQYDGSPPYGYNDMSYAQYILADKYDQMGMGYVGANDGMLHAFNFGLLGMINDRTNTNHVANLATPSNPGTNLGNEEWAYIPKNALPYLQYLGDPNYCHVFYVDASPYIFDASINMPAACAASNYWDCPKQTQCVGNPTCIGEVPCMGDPTCTSNLPKLDMSNTSWRTILIGGMGQGGGCRKMGDASCSNCVNTPILDPKDSTKGLGYSSYFALDITDQENPVLLWEVSDASLSSSDLTNGGFGFSTSGPAIVRVGSSDTTKCPVSANCNGRWFAVFASGPTGPIDTVSQQFDGYSGQNLKLFVVDLASGAIVKTIDLGTLLGITNAFGGSVINATIDADRGYPQNAGFYQDDVFYVGYTQQTNPGSSPPNWVGGVVRVSTHESNDPSTWTASKLISGIEPITSGISHLLDPATKRLWLYFGTGRYFFKTTSGIDDPTALRTLYGVKDLCYNNKKDNKYDSACTSSVGSLTNATLTPPTTEPDNGWFITLDPAAGTYGAERSITTPLAAFNGNVFFTTVEPSTDLCTFGGNTNLWAVHYNTGQAPYPGTLYGTALLQVSTGSIQQLPLATSFTQKLGRRTASMIGVPPKAQGLSIVLKPRALKKIMHMQEK